MYICIQKMKFDYEKEDFNNEPIMLYGYGG